MNSIDVKAALPLKDPAAKDVSVDISAIGVCTDLAGTVPGVGRPSGPFRSFRLSKFKMI